MICHYSTCVVPGTVEVAPVVFNLPKPVKKGSVISSFFDEGSAISLELPQNAQSTNEPDYCNAKQHNV